MQDHKTEAEALHTLRLVYADLMARANRGRVMAERFAKDKPESAIILRCKTETYTSAASILKMYCHKIGFDPSTKGEQNASIRKENEDSQGS